MRLLSCIFAILTAVAALAADGKDEKPKSDKELIQGTWDVVSSTEAGRAVPAENTRNLQIIFTADMMSFRPKDAKNPKDTTSIQYTLDPTKDPKEIDTSHELDPGKPILQLGIYSLERDTLKLNLEAAGKPRPTKLESKAGDTGILFVLKRENSDK